MSALKILLVEDDPGIVSFIDRGLSGEGHALVSLPNGCAALGEAQQVRGYDVIILDLLLPDMHGHDVCSQLREHRVRTPILMLTALDSVDDIIQGLNAGADDYVVKPFHFEEVSARVNALLRRSGGWATSVLTAGPVALDTARQELTVNEAAIDLTSFEYKIIEYLMLRAGQVISKSELTDRLYDQDFERDSNVIEVFIGRLRKKVDPENSIKPIETLRGRGYRFALERNQSG